MSPEMFEPLMMGTRDFGVGVDLEEVERWRKLLPRLREDHRRSIFHPEEHAYCQSFPDPAPQYAGRWTAKEAVVKAVFSFCRITLRDVTIRNEEDGRPCAIVHSYDFHKRNGIVRLSISHSPKFATAFAVALADRV